MQNVVSFAVGNKAAIMTGLFLFSEILALIPSVKANSVFQLCFGWLKSNSGA